MTHRADHFVFNQRVRRSRLHPAIPLTAGSVLGITLLAQAVQVEGGWLAVAILAFAVAVVGIGCRRGRKR